MRFLEVEMWRTLGLLILILTGLTAQDLSQDSLGLVGYGYAFPTPVYAAPGQLLTLMANVTGGGAGALCISSAFAAPFCSVRAPEGKDLPTVLAGISISWFGSVPTSLLAPILNVSTVSCSTHPDELGAALAAITIQIPLEVSDCRGVRWR
jgi:hypothetical protein